MSGKIDDFHNWVEVNAGVKKVNFKKSIMGDSGDRRCVRSCLVLVIETGCCLVCCRIVIQYNNLYLTSGTDNSKL